MSVGIVVVETSSLGDRTYLLHDGEVAVAVDPQRDIDRPAATATGTSERWAGGDGRRPAALRTGEIWVHCAAGYRAAAAASLLARAGHRVVHVDDDWANAAAAGLPIVVT